MMTMHAAARLNLQGTGKSPTHPAAWDGRNVYLFVNGASETIKDNLAGMSIRSCFLFYAIMQRNATMSLPLFLRFLSHNPATHKEAHSMKNYHGETVKAVVAEISPETHRKLKMMALQHDATQTAIFKMLVDEFVAGRITLPLKNCGRRMKEKS